MTMLQKEVPLRSRSRKVSQSFQADEKYQS
jgi:hypothetical protein